MASASQREMLLIDLREDAAFKRLIREEVARCVQAELSKGLPSPHAAIIPAERACGAEEAEAAFLCGGSVARAAAAKKAHLRGDWDIADAALELLPGNSRASAQRGVYTQLLPDDGGLPQEPSDVSARPESLFCFCLAWLAAKPEESRRAVALICGQTIVEIMLGLSLVISAHCSFLLNQWRLVPDEPLDLCFYTGKLGGPDLFMVPTPWFRYTRITAGVPLANWFCSALVILLVGLSMKTDDAQMLRAPYPSKGVSLFTRGLVFVSWSIRTFILPVVVGSGTTLMMVNSTRFSDILMNAVAVVFLLELDDLGYAALVSTERKAFYQDRMPVESTNGFMTNRAEWMLFAVNLTYMFVNHTMLSMGDWVQGPELDEESGAFLFAVMYVGVFFRGFFLNVFHSMSRWWAFQEAAGSAEMPSRPGLAIIFRDLLVTLFCQACVVGLVYVAYVPFQVDAVKDYETLMACTSGKDPKACLCGG